MSTVEPISREFGEARNDHAEYSQLPPELEAEVVQQFTDRYYRGWLEEEIPALAGRTPRRAAKLKTQRAKVAALVREIERTPNGGAAVDLGWLWEELGLADLR